MRELTKSMMSFTWAMSVFGMKQMGGLLGLDSPARVGAAFDAVTQATEGQLGPTTRQSFRAGDALQRGMVDMSFGMIDPRNLDPNRALSLGIVLLQRGVDAVYEVSRSGRPPQQGMSGWGAVPPPAA